MCLIHGHTFLRIAIFLHLILCLFGGTFIRKRPLMTTFKLVDYAFPICALSIEILVNLLITFSLNVPLQSFFGIRCLAKFLDFLSHQLRIA